MTAAGDDDGNDVDAPLSIGSVVLADVVCQMTLLSSSVPRCPLCMTQAVQENPSMPNFGCATNPFQLVKSSQSFLFGQIDDQQFHTESTAMPQHCLLSGQKVTA